MASPNPEALFIPQLVIAYPISSLTVMYFAYGFYILLFGACVCLTRSRQQTDSDEPSNGNLYSTLAAILFALSTTFVVTYTIDVTQYASVLFNATRTRNFEPLMEYFMHDVQKTAVFSLEQFLAIFLNMVADYMLIHRCYVIWDSQKQVALPLAVASILINVLGLTSVVIMTVAVSDMTRPAYMLYPVGGDISFAYYIASAIINSIITLLTAGRIWWIHRQVQTHAIESSDTFVESITRIILESGITYPVLAIVQVIMANVTSLEKVPFDTQPLVCLAAGIAPTLIMVRAKLGKNVEHFRNTAVSDIRFGTRSAQQSSVFTSQVHSVGVLPQVDTGGSNQERLDSEKEAIEV